MTITYSLLAFLPVICSETREMLLNPLPDILTNHVEANKIGTDSGGGFLLLFFFVTSPFKFSAYTKQWPSIFKYQSKGNQKRKPSEERRLNKYTETTRSQELDQFWHTRNVFLVLSLFTSRILLGQKDYIQYFCKGQKEPFLKSVQLSSLLLLNGAQESNQMGLSFYLTFLTFCSSGDGRKGRQLTSLVLTKEDMSAELRPYL